MSSLVRAIRSAVAIPHESTGVAAPYDTAHLTIRYPALPPQNDVERMSGMLSADPAGAPYPVVVLVPGVNVSSETYRWLAVAIVEAGLVCVSYDWVGLLFPGQYGLTPGVDLEAVTPEGYGSKPTTPAIGAVLRLAPREPARPCSTGCSTSTASRSSVTRPAARSRSSRRRPSGCRRSGRSRRTARTRWPRSSSATRPARCSPRPPRRR